MLALDVFSACIRYLKDHLTDTFADRISFIHGSEYHWVLTVPAIWNNAAKQFMRLAANKAGIDDEQLTLVLEPEAASLYCQLCSEKSTNIGAIGKKYMVLDCGGGTVDVIVHKVQRHGKLKELHKATGGDWGGTKVDDKFQIFLFELFGIAAIRRMTKHDALFLQESFEKVKKTLSSEELDFSKINIWIPECLNHSELNLKEEWRGRVRIMGDKLRIDASVLRQLFNEPVQSIVDHVDSLLVTPTLQGIQLVFMVGGFSESAILQDALRRKFPRVQFIVPNNASTAVLKGAVILGHDPNVVAWRIAAYTYGVKTRSKFNLSMHPVEKRRLIEGEEKCIDIFNRFISVGDSVKVGESTEEQTLRPTVTGQTRMRISVYASSARNPMYTTDPDCFVVGTFRVEMPDSTGEKNRKVNVKMTFGGTELGVEAIDGNTGRTFEGKYDFLTK